MNSSSEELPSVCPTGPRALILRYIEEHIALHGSSPRHRKIAEAVGLSPSTVNHHLRKLREMGLVTWDKGLTGTLRIQSGPVWRSAEGKHPVTRIPMLGTIAAGIPIPAAEEVTESFELPKEWTGEGEFIALRVKGDSMIGAAIADGDTVVVRRAPDANSGDIVAAMLDSDISEGAEATVKTLRKENGHVWLMPQNPDYMPIPGDTATLVGKVVTVLRRV